MTDREIKRLNRSDLLRLLVEQSKQMEAARIEASDVEARLRKENQQLRQQLEERQLRCNEAGNLAAAAVDISGVMEAAQLAADQYLENIRYHAADQNVMLQQQEAESKARVSQMLADAEQECAEKRAETEKACAQQKAETELLCKNATNEAMDQIDAYWAELQKRLSSFYESHQGLRQLLAEEKMEPMLGSDVMYAVLMSSPAGCLQ